MGSGSPSPIESTNLDCSSNKLGKSAHKTLFRPAPWILKYPLETTLIVFAYIAFTPLEVFSALLCYTLVLEPPGTTSDRDPQGDALLRWEQRGMLTTFPDTDEGAAMTVLGDVATACAFGAHRRAVIGGVDMSI
jgi:hypothetical protein